MGSAEVLPGDEAGEGGPLVESALFIVRAKGGKVKQLTPWGEIDENPTWSPNSRRIIFAVGPEGTIEAVRPDGSGRRTILQAVEGVRRPQAVVLARRRRILFMCENWGTLPEPPPNYNEDLCVMDADGSNIVNITNTPGVFENYLSWGPAPRGHDRDDDD